MSPEQLAALVTFAEVLGKLSGWPFGIMLFLFIVGPWIMALMLVYLQGRRHEKVVLMYENNVRLVEKYERMAGEQKDVIIMSTQATTRLIDSIEKNQFCPLMRVDGVRRIIQEKTGH